MTAQRLNNQTYEADVSLLIDNGVQIPDDSVAKIVSDGFLGTAHIAIEPGASEYMLQEGDKITITQGSVDLLGIAMKAFTSQAGGKNNDDAEEDPLGDL